MVLLLNQIYLFCHKLLDSQIRIKIFDGAFFFSPLAVILTRAKIEKILLAPEGQLNLTKFLCSMGI